MFGSQRLLQAPWREKVWGCCLRRSKTSPSDWSPPSTLKIHTHVAITCKLAPWPTSHSSVIRHCLSHRVKRKNNQRAARCLSCGHHYITVAAGSTGKNMWEKLNVIRERGVPRVSMMSELSEVLRLYSNISWRAESPWAGRLGAGLNVAGLPCVRSSVQYSLVDITKIVCKNDLQSWEQNVGGGGVNSPVHRNSNKALRAMVNCASLIVCLALRIIPTSQSF